MCLAIPMKLVQRNEETGVVELDGVQRHVSLGLVPEARLGDHLLIHAGYAIGKVDEAEAAETVRLLKELADLQAAEAGPPEIDAPSADSPATPQTADEPHRDAGGGERV